MSILTFMQKQKGSISIFLCLILLPMVTYAAMIVDGARLMSSRSAIANAGDLAMNAAMSEYEHTLEDMYGLFALAESEDDLKEHLKVYFAESIEGKFYNEGSKDLDAEQIASGVVDAAFGDDPVTDLNNLIEMHTESFDYKRVEGSTLANQAIMKRQIVDYMKYKGPISLSSTIFNKLDFLKDSSKQTEVLEKKVEYTEKLDNIQDACNAAWEAIEGKKREDGSYGSDGYRWYSEYFKSIGNEDPNTVRGIMTDLENNLNAMTMCVLMARNTHVEEPLAWSDLDISAFESEWGMDSLTELASDCTKSQAETQMNDIYQIYQTIIASLRSDYAAVEYDDYTESDTMEEDKAYNDAYDSVSVVLINSSDQNKPSKMRIDNYYNELRNIENLYQNYGGSIAPISDSEFPAQLETHFGKQNQYYDFASEESVQKEMARLKAAESCLSSLASQYQSAYSKYKELAEDEKKKQKNKTTTQNSKSETNKTTTQDSNSETTETTVQNSDTETTETTTTQDSDSETEKEEPAIDFEYSWKNGLLKATSDRYNSCGIRSSISSFLTKVSDKSLYLHAGDYYSINAITPLREYYLDLTKISSRCLRIINALTTIENKIKEAETKKTEWQGKVNSLPSGSTKSSLQSDLDTTTNGLELEDIQNFKAAVTKVKDAFDARAEMIYSASSQKGVSYLGAYIAASVKSYDASTNTMMNSVLKAAMSDDAFKLSEGTSISQAADSIMLSGYDRSSFPILETGKVLKTEKFDGDPLPDEQFYLTLKSVCEPYGKTGLNSNDTNVVDNINEIAKVDEEGNSSFSKDKTSKTSGETAVSGNEEKNDEKEQGKEDGKEEKTTQPDLGGIYDDISKKAKISGPPDENTVKISGMNISEKDDYKNDSKAAKDSLKAANTILNSLSEIAVSARDYAYIEEYFTEMFTCRTHPMLPPERQTLLNGYGTVNTAYKPLNTNTPWYGNEIEYIMWGNSDLEKNRAYTDAWIFAVRFALNAIYAFTAADIQAFSLEAATALAGWTVIGVPIVQACITIAIAVAESSYDMILLHDGEDVPIYKSQTTFVCSPTGLAQKAGEQATEKLVSVAADYANNAIDDQLDKIQKEAYDSIDDAMQDVNAVLDNYVDSQVEGMISSIVDQFATPLVNAVSPVLTNIDATRNDAIDTLDKNVENAVNTALEDIHENITNGMSDGLARKYALKLYDEVIKKEKGVLISKIQEYYKKVLDDNVPEDSANTLRGFLADKDNGIIAKWLRDSFGDSIKGEIEKMTSKASQNIKDLGNDGMDNIKSSLHNEINNMSSEISGSITTTVKKHSGSSVTTSANDTSSANGFTLNYKEYCKLIVFVKLIAGQQDVMLNRAATLMQANVMTAKNGSNPNFKITEAYTLVSIDATVEMGTLFPWGVQMNDSTAVDGSTDFLMDWSNWGKNSININYYGVNGY